MNPYLTLNVSPTASNTEIRNRYLHLAKRYTPTQAPKEFAQIAQAYELIDTPEKRLQIELLGNQIQPLSAGLVKQSLAHVRMHRTRPQWAALCQHFGHTY